MLESPKDWFFLISGLVGVAMLISMLTFGRLTLVLIEKNIKRDGLPRPCPWDGPGARIIWHAYAIGLPVGRLNRIDDPMIDLGVVRKYATAADRLRAVVLLVSSAGFLVVLLIGALAFDIEKPITASSEAGN